MGGRFEVGDVAADAEQDVACGLTPIPGIDVRTVRRGWSSEELLDTAADLAPPVLIVLMSWAMEDDGLGHEGAGHGDGLLADRLEHVVDNAAGAEAVLDLAQSFVPRSGPFRPLGPPYRSSSASVASRDSLALERARSNAGWVCGRLREAVDVAGGFVGEVLVVAGEQLPGRRGLVIRARVPGRLGQQAQPTRSHARPAVGLRVPGSSCAGPAHGRAGR